jgi:hypothetical protein
LAAALFAGCSAAAPVTPTPLAPLADSSGARQKARATFTIRVPRHSRHPHYVSPSTRSIGITVDPGTANQKIVNANLAFGVTTLVIVLTPGAHTFNFRTYDGALVSGSPSGRLLSINTAVPFTVKKGQNNPIGVVLQGVPAGIAVIPDARQDVTGDVAHGFTLVGAMKADGATIFPRSFTVVAVDAGGNFIFGPGSPAISVTSSNTTVISNGVVFARNPTRFSFTPGNIVAVPVAATMTATATPKAGSGAAAFSAKFLMHVSNFNAPRIYGTGPSFGSVKVWDENGNSITLPGSPFSQVQLPGAITYDAHNDSIYVYDGVTEYLYRFTTAGSFSGRVLLSSTPTSMAYDGGTGYLYAAYFDAGVGTFTEALSPVALAGNWHEAGSGAVPVFPTAIVPDTNAGRIFVLDGAAVSSVVQAYTALGQTTTTTWVPNNGGNLTLTGMAQDPATGYLYVMASSSAVQVFDESGNPVSVSGGFSGLTSAELAQWDATNARLYIYDNSLGKMFAFDGQGNSVALSGTFPGTSTLAQYVVVP